MQLSRHRIFTGTVIALLYGLTHLPLLAVADGTTKPAEIKPRVLFLKTQQLRPDPMSVSVLSSELYRQGFLIAARDNLGLQTRDESLREWRGQPPAGSTLTFIPGDLKPGISVDGNEKIWKDMQPDDSQWQKQVVEQSIKIEALSRNEFVKLLRDQGFAGDGNTMQRGAPAPADAENRLNDFEVVSQYTILRETHEMIRTQGESEARVGVLVRAYANLGQFTRFQWSIEPQVFTARSLLYAQRMVAADPKSAMALWHRAYAMAMAGFQGQTLKDLTAARRLGDESKAPKWVSLLEPFCHYDGQKLADLVDADDSLAQLGSYLEFLTLEHSNAQIATLRCAQKALVANPECLRLIDAMCNSTGPGLLNRLAEDGPRVFSATLGSKVEKIPGLPHSVIQKIHDIRRPGGNPRGREAVCQVMIDEGVPEKDLLEPSLAALARTIQETAFAHIRRKSNLMAVEWGLDASDYTAEVQPLIAEHRFKGVINAYGAFHEADPGKAADALKTVQWNDLTMAEYPLYVLDYQFQSRGPDTALKLGWFFVSGMDASSFDKETWLSLYADLPRTNELEEQANDLQAASPDSPLLTRYNIIQHWNPAHAEEWERTHGNYPAVSMALGTKFTELHQWKDAERCLQNYIRLSPDVAGYTALASMYKDQGNDAKWLETLKAFVTQTDNIGLEHARVQTEIAAHYMSKGQFKEALPFAESAANTGAAWGLVCAVNANTGAGNYARAEKLMIEKCQHYSESPFTWFTWCVQTGHGDQAVALEAFKDYIKSQGNNMSGEDLLQSAYIDAVSSNKASAIITLNTRFTRSPGPLSITRLILFADEIDDIASRDTGLKALKVLRSDNSNSFAAARELERAYRPGLNVTLNLKAIDAILKRSDPIDRIEIGVLTARYLAKHGPKNDAIRYAKQCYSEYHDYCADDLLLYQTSRELGIEPLSMLMSPATQPAN